MFDIDTFVADCREALRESSPEAAVREVVARAVAEPAEVEQALRNTDPGRGRPAASVSRAHHPQGRLGPGMAIYPHDHRMWPSSAFTAAARTTRSTAGAPRV